MYTAEELHVYNSMYIDNNIARTYEIVTILWRETAAGNKCVRINKICVFKINIYNINIDTI